MRREHGIVSPREVLVRRKLWDPIADARCHLRIELTTRCPVERHENRFKPRNISGPGLI
jgi:hypothetical protein